MLRTKRFATTLLLGAVFAAPLAGATIAVTSGLGLSAPAAAATMSKLGDLSSFRTIAVDTKALADKGDLAAAKARIKDLETAWDDVASDLRARDKAEWRTLDKAIDAALADLRAKSPDASACRKSLDELLATIDAAA